MTSLGATSWTLQAWLGHSSINMTQRYVHHVQARRRPIPEEILSAQIGFVDPDERVIAMLGARSRVGHGNAVAMDRRSLSST
jgi:hypothetical protein